MMNYLCESFDYERSFSLGSFASLEVPFLLIALISKDRFKLFNLLLPFFLTLLGELISGRWRWDSTFIDLVT